MYKPGESGNPNGRPKGSVNKDLAIARDLVSKALKGKTIIEEMIAVAGDDRGLKLRVYEALLPYCYRKLSPVEAPVGGDDDEEQLNPAEVAIYDEALDNMSRGTKDDTNG